MSVKSRLLLTRTAHARLSGGLASFGDTVDVTTIDLCGKTDVTLPPPNIAYLTADLLRARLLPRVAELMKAAWLPRWAYSCAAGTDGAAFDALSTSGVQLVKSDAQAPAIADYILCRTLAELHPITDAALAQATAQWRRLSFREIGDTHWLIVGFGAIGREVARRLKPFGASISAIRRDPGNDPLVERMCSPPALRDILPDADVVVLACPLTDDTRGMADSSFFRRMKPGAIFVNVGRGALVDDTALLAGLDAGRPSVAILDVFVEEPLPQTSRLWTHPAVRITAHGAGAGSGVAARNDACFLDNLRRFLAGEPLVGTVAPSSKPTLEICA